MTRREDGDSDCRTRSTYIEDQIAHTDSEALMRTISLLILILTAALVASAQTASLTASLQILAPKSGEKINNSFVTVQYELASPASASSMPTFQLRLDSLDPVQTTDTQYTFTGVPPGTHTITIQVVDANNTPLPGVQNQVQFTVQPPASPQTPAGMP